jgi:hypothetical protein
MLAVIAKEVRTKMMTLARSEDEKGDAGIQSEGSEDDDDDDRSEDLSVKFEKLKPPHDPSVTRWATKEPKFVASKVSFRMPFFSQLRAPRTRSN